jgi:hypothetical protein
MAWDWMFVEAYAALCRRRATPDQFTRLSALEKEFELFSLQLDSVVRLAIFKLLQKYRLRSADAGHLYLLKLVKKIPGKLDFVCFDAELVNAAECEGIRVVSKN